MQIPKIEKEIIKKKNRVNSALAFIGAGVGAMVATHGLSGLGFASFAIPVAFDVYTMNNLLNGKREWKTKLALYEPLFHRGMRKWVNQYVNSSEDLLEKKYKLIFLKLWLNHKNLSLENLTGFTHDIFDKLSEDLRKEKLCEYHIDLLFNSYSGDLEKIYGKKVTTMTFIEDDSSYPERLDIAKKVYEEYANFGIIGKALTRKEKFEPLLKLQEYKLTNADYQEIEKYTKELTQKDQFAYYIDDPYVDNATLLLKEVLHNENDIKHLTIIENFCRQVIKIEDDGNFPSLAELANAAKVRIGYLDLGHEINNKDEPKPEQSEPKKIKKMKL